MQQGFTVDMDVSAQVHVKELPDYDGPTSVTPSKQTQTLATSGKALSSDITVEAIPSSMIGGKAIAQYLAGGPVDLTREDVSGKAITSQEWDKLVSPYLSTSDNKGIGTLFELDVLRDIDLDFKAGERPTLDQLYSASLIRVLRLTGCTHAPFNLRYIPSVIDMPDVTTATNPFSTTFSTDGLNLLLLPSVSEWGMGMRLTLSDGPVNYEYDPYRTGNPIRMLKRGVMIGKPGGKLHVCQGATIPSTGKNGYVCIGLDNPSDITFDNGATAQDTIAALSKSAGVCVNNEYVWKAAFPGVNFMSGSVERFRYLLSGSSAPWYHDNYNFDWR